MQTEYIKKITQSLIILPTLSTIAAQLPELLYDEKNKKDNRDSLERIISTCPVLAARFLKMANARGEPVTGIHNAVSKLGFEELKDICMEISLSGFFDLKNSGVDSQKFWDHCHAVGIAARIVAQEHKFGLTADEAFTAGLLHDFGKVIFLHYKSKEFEQAVNLSKSRPCELYLAESEYLGVNHGQTGAALARKWLLPNSIVEVMQYHHDLANTEIVNRPLVAIVNFADILCRILVAGDSGNHAAPAFTVELAKELAKWDFNLESSWQSLMALCIDELDERGLTHYG